MRYLIDQRGLEPEIALAFYRTALAWAAKRGQRFVIHLRRGIYGDPQDAARLCALGEPRASTPHIPKDLPGRLIARMFPAPSDMVWVEGMPDQVFVSELTRTGAPLHAVSGDLCPVE